MNGTRLSKIKSTKGLIKWGRINDRCKISYSKILLNLNEVWSEEMLEH